MIRIFLALILLPITLFASDDVAIITSIRPLQSIVTNLTKDIDNVELIIDKNESIHNYHLKPTKMTKLHNSRIIIIIDKHFEIFLSKVLANLTQKHKLIEVAKIPGVNLLKNSKEDETLHHHHHISPYDLHIWLDIEIIKTASKEIVRFLSEVTPSNQSQYEANLAEFIIKLDNLDNRIRKKTSSINNEDYIVTHNAYRYFIKRYNLKEPKTITIDHDHNIGARSFIQLQELIRNNKVKCIFEEPQFKSQIVKKLEENSNVRVGSLDAEWGPKDVSIEDAYIVMMDNLADSFVTCLK